jgi:hypothetical protein
MGETCSTHGGNSKPIEDFSQTIYWKEQVGRLGVYGNIIVKWILKNYGVRVWIGLIWIWIGSNGGML